MAAELFDDFADAFDAMIDWPARLTNEEPFFREVLRRAGAGRVLDCACGTGHHAAMFASWGLSVEGADASEAMIGRCIERYGQSPTLRSVVRGFDRPVDMPGSFDAAICIGNSLALAANRQVAAEAVKRMFAAVRGGGAVVLHVLNLWRFADGPCIWQKCIRANLQRGESLIIKGVHRNGSNGFIDMVVTELGPKQPVMRNSSIPFLGFRAEELCAMATDAGAGDMEVFGNYHREAYDADESQDLILLAWRRPAQI